MGSWWLFLLINPFLTICNFLLAFQCLESGWGSLQRELGENLNNPEKTFLLSHKYEREKKGRQLFDRNVTFRHWNYANNCNVLFKRKTITTTLHCMGNAKAHGMKTGKSWNCFYKLLRPFITKATKNYYIAHLREEEKPLYSLWFSGFFWVLHKRRNIFGGKGETPLSPNLSQYFFVKNFNEAKSWLKFILTAERRLGSQRAENEKNRRGKREESY